MHSPFWHTALPLHKATTWQVIGRCPVPISLLMPISVLVWVHSFIEQDLFEHVVPFDNSTPIYLINLLWKLGLGLGLELKELCYFSIFHSEYGK